MEYTSEATPPQSPPYPRRSFGARLLAALALEAAVYEEVEHDRDALAQAAGIVCLAAVASAIGSFGALGSVAIPGALISAFASWVLWAAIVWVVGVKLFHHSSSYEELLRTLGFVAAPQLLYVLAVVPIAVWQGLVGLVVLGMTLVAFVRATRQALDVDTPRALVVSALGLLVYVLLAAAVGAFARIA